MTPSEPGRCWYEKDGYGKCEHGRGNGDHNYLPFLPINPKNHPRERPEFLHPPKPKEVRLATDPPSRHTPGPWEVGMKVDDLLPGLLADHGYLIGDPHRIQVALALSHDPTEAKANAELIASAPSLQDQVERLRRTVKELLERTGHDLDDEGECGDEMHVRALAALAPKEIRE